MSANKPNHSEASELREIRGAFSSKAWSRALDNRIRQYPDLFNFLWEQRFWWIVAGAITFCLPVLQNDNSYWLSYSRSTNLYGFDLLVPMLSSYGDNNNIVYVSSFSVNPLALLIYGLAVVHLYLLFVGTRVSARLTLWHAAIQTIATALFPFLDITVLNWVLPGFKSYWHVQPPLTGFWILLVSGLLLWAASYGRILRGLPVHEPPPLD
jgi:hypothetical protein